jgi:hypothetical protein
LLAGWLLFQQAKSELTARASEAPVLAEIKALQKSVAALLEQLKLESAQASTQLEARCVEARDLLAALDRRIEALQTGPAKRLIKRRSPAIEFVETGDSGQSVVVSEAEAGNRQSGERYECVYSLADEGLAAAAISQQTGYSEGEIELILGMRQRAS